MSKRPRVSLSSIVAETARQAGDASAVPGHSGGAASLDEGAPIIHLMPTTAARAPEPTPSVPVDAPPPIPAVTVPSPVETAAVAEPSFAAIAMPATAPDLAAPADTSSGVAMLGLPAILDLKAAGELRDKFCAAKGGPLEVDASKVQRLGGLCLQVLLSAQRTWIVDGKPFRVVDPSPDFLDGLKAFGATALAESTPAAT